MTGWLTRHWYASRPIWFLAPFSAVFRAAVWLRRGLYRRGVLRARRVSARVVVVGNISVGGNGKTPLVAWLVRNLAGAGVKTGIVTRGYGRMHADVRLVDERASVAEVGDEALWLARETGVPVAAGRERAAAAECLVEKHHPGVIVCDDGLQHYRLARDVEIVAIDARRGFGNGALLPAGPLRETPARLAQADAIVLKGQGNLALPDPARVFTMRVSVSRALPVAGGEPLALSRFQGRRVRAVAGIADPEGFFAALEAGGLQVERYPLADHAPVDSIVAALGSGRPVLVTDKDAVRLTGRPANVWRVPLAVGFSDAEAVRLLGLVRGDASLEEKS